jgi:hypothetical protein
MIDIPREQVLDDLNHVPKIRAISRQQSPKYFMRFVSKSAKVECLDLGPDADSSKIDIKILI